MSLGRQVRDREQAHVTKLVGAPGSGKTTNMLRLLRDELRGGTELSEILFLTFARAAREEVEERLIDIADEEDALDDEVEPGDRVRTLHSAALQACKDEGAIEIRHRNNLDAYGDLLITRTKVLPRRHRRHRHHRRRSLHGRPHRPRGRDHRDEGEERRVRLPVGNSPARGQRWPTRT